MKLPFALFLLVALTSCITTTTTITKPDGTIVVTKTQGADSSSVASVSSAATSIYHTYSIQPDK